MRTILGVDPGASGGYAFLEISNHGQVNVSDAGPLPVWKLGANTLLDAQVFWKIISNPMPDSVMLEQSGPIAPGKKAVFQGGLFLGSLLTTFHLRHLPLETVAPHVWKKAMGLTISKSVRERLTTSQASSKRKEASMNLAAERFGEYVREKYFPTKNLEGVAEAMLIALYAIDRRR